MRKQIFKKIALSLFSVLTALCFIEFACGWLISKNFQIPSRSLSGDQSHIQPGLLPYELPTSLGQLPKFERTRVPGHQEHEDHGSFVEEGGYASSEVPVRLFKSRSQKVKKYSSKSDFVVFDVTVTSDQFGRRISRPLDSQRASRRHLLLMGCSYVFGDAINDTETLTWAMNKKQNEFEAFNAGVGGYGTSDVLARFLTGNEMAGIPQKEGVLVYNFIGDHLHRALGASTISWRESLSYVTQNSTGAFTFEGAIGEKKKFLNWFYNWFSERNLAKLFHLSLPILRDDHYAYIARLIAATQAEYQKQSLPQNKLVVAIYPELMYSVDIRKLRQALSDHKIYFLDYSPYELAEYVQGPARVAYDFHPNAAANQVYAEVLLKDIDQFLRSAPMADQARRGIDRGAGRRAKKSGQRLNNGQVSAKVRRRTQTNLGSGANGQQAAITL